MNNNLTASELFKYIGKLKNDGIDVTFTTDITNDPEGHFKDNIKIIATADGFEANTYVNSENWNGLVDDILPTLANDIVEKAGLDIPDDGMGL